MHNEIKKILIQKSRRLSKKRRLWKVVVTVDSLGVETKWWFRVRGKTNERTFGGYRYGKAPWQQAVDPVPAEVIAFLNDGLEPKPKDVPRATAADLIDKRAAKAEKMLADWEKKLRTALSRTAKYRKQVSYYQRERARVAAGIARPVKQKKRKPRRAMAIVEQV